MALDFLAGCLGGCAGVIVGYPLDTVKVHLQAQDGTRPVYRGTFHCMASIIKNESVLGLYKGMTSPLTGLAFINAIAFGVYGNVQRSFSDPSSVSSQVVAGTAAGAVQSLICSPMELAKMKMQLQDPVANRRIKTVQAYKSPVDCLLKIARQEGMRGVFRGLGCTVLRDAPGFGAYFASYEFLAHNVLSDGTSHASTGCLLIAGGLAGMISWIVVYPVDVLKTRMQADSNARPKQYQNMWDCAVKSYRQEGIRVFSRGLNSTIIRAFPTNAVTFAVASWVFKFLGDSHECKDGRIEKHSPAMLMEKEINRVATHVDTCL